MRNETDSLATEPPVCQSLDCFLNRYGICHKEFAGLLRPGVQIVTCAAYRRDDELKARIEAREIRQEREEYRQMVRMGEYQ